MAVVWFVSFIILLLIEIVTVNLVSIWFAVGALASCVVAYFCDSLILQIGVFLVVSTAILIFAKPFSRKVKKGVKIATNLDRVIGMEAIVTEDISKNKCGEVKVDGKRWTAISKDDLAKNDIVIVKKIDGVKLIVEKED